MALQKGGFGARKVEGHFLVFRSEARKGSLEEVYCFRGGTI